LAAGVGNGSTPLAVTFPIANNPGIVGLTLFKQGIHVAPATNAEQITRAATFVIPYP
jgi:hypothetical protein